MRGSRSYKSLTVVDRVLRRRARTMIRATIATASTTTPAAAPPASAAMGALLTSLAQVAPPYPVGQKQLVLVVGGQWPPLVHGQASWQDAP